VRKVSVVPEDGGGYQKIMRIPALNRVAVAFVHDVVMAAISFVLALYLRLGDALFVQTEGYLLPATLLFTGIAAAVFWWTGLYRGVWRYASMDDLLAITRAVTLALLVFLVVMFLATRLEALPRSALLINWFVLMALLGGPRLAYRLYKDRRLDLRRKGKVSRRIPVLLIGAGDNAETFIRELARNPDSEYRVVGLVDATKSRIGRVIHGLAVMGDLDEIPKAVEKLTREGKRPQRLILTREHLEGERVRALLDTADALGIPLSRLPRLTDFRQADIKEGLEVRPIALADLLGRAQNVLDRDGMKALIRGKRVLVTGAGGTIGSELVRQIADYGPARIALLDHAEFLLYGIDIELSGRHPEIPRTACLCDIRDRAALTAVLDKESPELVFHAAALKHVPMVEANPIEGILTNTVGTRNLAEACRQAGVAAMVMVSTDKAVNPTNVMGATKRLAESFCQALDLAAEERETGTRFITVRFGNVLGSTGSVVPRFENQIAAGGPLTVTHPEMIRYFMSLREAVELILQASALGCGDRGKSGKIFVLEMGEPVRIADLARQMIRLAGLRPEIDVKIEYSGLRPGEKLFEELFHDAEAVEPAGCPGLLLASPRSTDLTLLARSLNELEAACRARRAEVALETLRALVPEYGAPSPEAARTLAAR
jgi:O-antigen biosynthesis protein WbqV